MFLKRAFVTLTRLVSRWYAVDESQTDTATVACGLEDRYTPFDVRRSRIFDNTGRIDIGL